MGMVAVDAKSEPKKTEDGEKDKESFDELKDKLVALNEPRYVLYDFGFTAKGGRKLTKLAFIFWWIMRAASRQHAFGVMY